MSVPRVSASPSATLADWTAPPDAPFVRLSIAESTRTVPVRSSYRAVRWTAFVPSVALVEGAAVRTATNGSPA